MILHTQEFKSGSLNESLENALLDFRKMARDWPERALSVRVYRDKGQIEAMLGTISEDQKYTRLFLMFAVNDGWAGNVTVGPRRLGGFDDLEKTILCYGSEQMTLHNASEVFAGLLVDGLDYEYLPELGFHETELRVLRSFIQSRSTRGAVKRQIEDLHDYIHLSVSAISMETLRDMTQKLLELGKKL